MRECRVFWSRTAVLAALGCCLVLLIAAPLLASNQEPGRAVASSALLRELDFLEANPFYDYPIPVIGTGGAPAAALAGSDLKILPTIDGFSARLSARQIREFLAAGRLKGLTLDTVIRVTADGTPSRRDTVTELNPFLAAVGAPQAADLGYDGAGVGVAVFDSGIAPHPDLSDGRRIRLAVDFTSGSPVFPGFNLDEYGHGTHVAGIIAGDGRLSGGRNRGVAPAAELIDVKVVGADGRGRTSNLIMAIGWVTELRRELGVSVANFSVSRPPTEPHFDDPLCAAVREMVDAGVIVVASAGNLGKFGDFPEIWASISSPGIDPAAITVYPVNNRGTASHGDDVATSYGSRGPAFETHFFKPDLAAPGNRVVSLRSPIGLLGELNGGVDSDYVELSGASMAAPFVSGAAALIAQASPGIQPRMAKLALLASAVLLEQPHRLQQGNGMLNVYGGVRIAEMMRDGAAPDWSALQWTLDGRTVLPQPTFVWNNRLLANPVFRAYTPDAGRAEFMLRDGPPRPEALRDGTGADVTVWSENSLGPDVTVWSEDALNSDVIVWSESALNSDVIVWSEGVLLSDVIVWSESALDSDVIVWSEGVLLSDVIVWSERFLNSDVIVWSEGVLLSDVIVWSENVLNSDVIVWSENATAAEGAWRGDPE